MAYTVTQIAELLDVAQNTVRNWERELSPFITAVRDSSGVRHYDDQALAQLHRVGHLREMGLSVSMIHQIFEIMLEDRMDASIAATVEEYPIQEEPFPQSYQQIQDRLQAFIEQNLLSIDVVQRDILDNVQQLSWSPKRNWFRR